MNLRKSLTLVSMVVAVATSAKTLSPEDALQRLATQQDAPRAVIQMAGKAPRLVKTVNTANQLPAVYLFDVNANGFMAVSADDVATPLLGYGDDTIVEGQILPDNLQYWLDEYASQIEAAQKRENSEAYVSTQATSANWTPIQPMLKTNWDQNAPYNNQCPVVSGQRAVTGCVATAMAQIMNYFKYPTSGTGSISYTDRYKNSYSMNFGSFDWNNMLNEYVDGKYTTEQANAIAYLMKSCGYAAQMSYSSVESGAVATVGCRGLFEYFGYSPKMKYYERPFFTSAEWAEMIYENLAKVGPIFYSGRSATGGHAFVCDGYDGNGYFHFNWGWSGYCNGHFLLTALVPEGAGTGGYIDGYNLSQAVILGIQPNDGSDQTPEGYMYLGEPLSLRYEAPHIYFDGGLYNNQLFSCTYAAGMLIEDMDGNEVQSSFINEAEFAVGGGYSSYGLYVGNLADGTYKVYPIYKQKGATEYHKMLNKKGENGYGFLIVENGNYSVAMPESGSLNVVNVSHHDFYRNSTFEVSAEFSNPSDEEICYEVAVGFARNNEVIAFGSPMFLALQPNESIQKAVASSVYTYDNTTAKYVAGDYDLVVFNTSSGKIYYSQPCTVKETPSGSKVALVSLKFNGDRDNAIADAISYAVTIQCTKGIFSNMLELVVFKNTEGSLYSSIGTIRSDYVFLNEDESATVNYKFDLHKFAPDLKPGDNFAVAPYATIYDPAQNANVRYKLYGLEVFTIGKTSGVEDIKVDNIEPEYYNLQGIRMTGDLPAGLYIRRQGNNVTKVIVK